MEISILKYMPKNYLDVPVIGKRHFKSKKMINISLLKANQDYIRQEVMMYKIKGINLSIPYVLRYKDNYILLDGHHTVCAKIVNKKIKCLCFYLEI